MEPLNSHTQIEGACSHRKTWLVQIVICSEQRTWFLSPSAPQQIGYLAPLSLFCNIFKLICTIQRATHRFMLDLLQAVTSKYWCDMLKSLQSVSGHSRWSKLELCLEWSGCVAFTASLNFRGKAKDENERPSLLMWENIDLHRSCWVSWEATLH